MLTFTSYASGSKGNLYSLGDGKTSLLLEAGLPIRQLRKFVFLHDHLACLVTHEHKDHARAVSDIIHSGIDCYMTLGTSAGIGIDPACHRLKIITPGEYFSIGEWSIVAFDVHHDAEQPVGYFIINGDGERFVFMTDTCYTDKLFPGCKVMALECSYCDHILESNYGASTEYKTRIMKTHFSLNNLLKLLASNDLKSLEEIYLLHLSDQHSDEEVMRKEVQRAVGSKVKVTIC